MVLWACPHCNHDFDPLEQEPYWQNPDDVVLIDCPNCGEWIGVQYADDYRKEADV